MNRRFLATVVCLLTAVPLAWAGARVVDRVECSGLGVGRVDLVAPGVVEKSEPVQAAEAAAWGRQRTGLALSPPCDGIPKGFLLNSLSLETGAVQGQNGGPRAEWSIVRHEEADPAVNVTRWIRIGYSPRGSRTFDAEGKPVRLGFGEELALRWASADATPGPHSAKHVMYHLYFKDEVVWLAADTLLGQGFEDETLRRLLRSATRGSR